MQLCPSPEYLLYRSSSTLHRCCCKRRSSGICGNLYCIHQHLKLKHDREIFLKDLINQKRPFHSSQIFLVVPGWKIHAEANCQAAVSDSLLFSMKTVALIRLDIFNRSCKVFLIGNHAVRHLIFFLFLLVLLIHKQWHWSYMLCWKFSCLGRILQAISFLEFRFLPI